MALLGEECERMRDELAASKEALAAKELEMATRSLLQQSCAEDFIVQHTLQAVALL